MEELKEKISLRCTFCRSSEFALPYGRYSPPPESFIVCAYCGRENDVTSLLIVAKSTGVSIAKNYADKLADEMKKDLIKIFGKSKFIKIK